MEPRKQWFNINPITPRFDIGSIVYSKVLRKGADGKSVCSNHDQLEVMFVKPKADSFEYICGKEGYALMEEELMSKLEYEKSIAQEG